jgi:VanZ family protein
MEFLLACFFPFVIGYWLSGMLIKKLPQIHQLFFEPMYSLNSKNISCQLGDLIVALLECAEADFQIK